ncbi:hypothetical protein H4582DRAFT_2179394 [Lactarius indigo]|nr:hypothetical protein H4582DRAFT_2179394 [Lactarius indigo]
MRDRKRLEKFSDSDDWCTSWVRDGEHRALKREGTAVRVPFQELLLCATFSPVITSRATRVSYERPPHGYRPVYFGLRLKERARAFDVNTILRGLFTAEPNQFHSRIASLQSLRANIFVDLRQNADAALAAEEAVTILKDHGGTQLELVYAMLNYAVLLGSIGRGEPAATVAFELMEYIETTRYGQIWSSFPGQNDPACAISAEAVTLFRSASADRPVFSFLHAHAISTHSHQLSEANRKGDSYSTIQEAVELRQDLQTSALVATKRPLAWALFELAKYQSQREESAEKYALDLICSLSLASSCLACTEQSEDALEYAKQAVEVQHGRSNDGDEHYSNHLRQLLMDVVFRSMEMDRERDAIPWMQELRQLGTPGDTGDYPSLRTSRANCCGGSKPVQKQHRGEVQKADQLVGPLSY